MLTEEQGCRTLETAFRRRGYRVTRNAPFDERGVSFEIDGWDPAARVGFEYLTRREGDHDDLTQAELALLIPRIEAGELYLLVIDEAQVADADELLFAADRFLDEVQRRGDGRTAPRKKKPTPKKKKRASAKPAPKRKKVAKATRKSKARRR